jgi:tetratricopeptide (TPR) repeat protein
MEPDVASPATAAPGRGPVDWRHALPLLLVLVTALCYANSLRGPFLFDDVNFEDEDALPFRNRPVLRATIDFNRWISTSETLGYHLLNVAIHALAGLCLFGLVRRTLERLPGWPAAGRRTLFAFGVALLWLVHPLQTQSVSYLCQRGEALAGLVYLLTVYAFVRSATGTPGRPRLAWSVVALLALALGMGSKEIVATAPLLVLLYDRTFLAGSFRAALLQRWPLHVALCATALGLSCYLILGQLFAPDAAMGFGTSAVTPLEYARTQPAVVLHYLRLCLWPHPLVLDYTWKPAREVREYLLPLVLVALLLLATLWALRRGSWLGFLGAWFFVILAPTSSFMPIEDLAFEHRMYLSLAAVATLFAAVLEGLRRRSGLHPFVPAALLLATASGLAARTVLRNQDYRSAIAMWESVLARVPENARALNNLGIAYLDAGRTPEAVRVLEESVHLWPHVKPLSNLGRAHLLAGQVEQALAVLEHALAREPGSPQANLHAGNARLALGDGERALEHFRRALVRKPRHAGLHYSAGNALKLLERLEEAVGEYSTALELDPEHQAAHTNLGVCLAALGRRAQALEHFARAVAIAPNSAEEHFNYGRCLLASSQPEAAVRELRAALALAPELTAVQEILGQALLAQPAPTPAERAEAEQLARRAARGRPENAGR